VAIWLKENKHLNVWEQQAYLVKALNGHYQYLGLRLCCTPLYGVRQRVRKLWRKALLRRSQRAKKRCDWTSLAAKPWFQLPKPRVTQAWV
jgi:hypothetical protein